LTLALPSARHHPDLPSPPTRRSSDLGASSTPGGNDAAYTMTLLPDGSSVLVGKARIGPDDDFAILKFTPGGNLDTSSGPIRALPDRKSTRLNSSHRTISYAVFCLKKK